MNLFAKYSWGVLDWNMLVILWDAIVRTTSSGVDFGNHWPGCIGEIIPTPQRIQTVIEFTHRLMRGLALILLLILLIWGLRNFPNDSHQRVEFIGAEIFIIFEALHRAGLVLFKLVGTNSSVFMAMAVSIHLLNTFILLAPAWMQVVNFFQADTGWVTYVLLASHTFSLTELEVL